MASSAMEINGARRMPLSLYVELVARQGGAYLGYGNRQEMHQVVTVGTIAPLDIIFSQPTNPSFHCLSGVSLFLYL